MKVLKHALALLALFTLPLAASAARTENRCGWFENPTPSNVWLIDRDGEWIIGLQGGHMADGDWPAFRESQWVKTNGHYGYGCACLRIVVDPRTREVSEIKRAKALPLASCRADRRIRNLEPRLN